MTLARSYFQPLPRTSVKEGNPATAEKIFLGKVLYFDPRLSRNQTQSCNTCHDLATFGVDRKATSPGDLGKPGTRNSPTTFNAAFHFTQFWDGRSPDVEDQAGLPVLNPIEMNMPGEEVVISRLRKAEGYRKLFAEAFPGEKEPITFQNMKNAIGVFERTLITPSRFDAYLEGDTAAITTEEKAGMEVFIRVGCTTCHSGPLLGGQMFHKYPLFDFKSTHGVTHNSGDPGRMEATGLESDRNLFKVSSMRNVTETYPYFHDGGIANLDDAIVIMAERQLNRTITGEDTRLVAAFLVTLTGDLPEDIKRPPVLP